MHTGEGFASLGHNHPDVRAVLQAALGEDLLDGVQIHYSALSGMLAEALAAHLPKGRDAIFFASTGAEAVDAAMKFARAATGRTRFVSCQSSFHGVTFGPLSIVGDEFFKEGFGPLLPGCELVPFGDLERLEAQLRRGDVAAFVVEPIQGRTVAPAPAGYLQAAQELCRRYGTMFVLDEIQTGLGRTGRWFALDEWGLEPDFVLVGKALSGGYMPVAAMATTRDIFQRAVGTLERSYVHQSTYGRNRLSMAAGLATIRIVERDGLVERSAQVGALLRAGLAELQGRHEIIKEVRGRGLMIGIELGAPRGSVARVSWRLVRVAAEGLYPQLIVIPLHRDHGVITMAAGKNDVIKLLPPLTLSEAEAQTLPRCLRRRAGGLRGVDLEELGRRSRHRQSHPRPAWPGARRGRGSGHEESRSPGRGEGRRPGDGHRPGEGHGGARRPGGDERERRGRADHGSHRLHRRPPRETAGVRRAPGPLPGARAQRHPLAGGARRGARGRRPDERTVPARRRGRVRVRVPLRRAGLRLGHHPGDHPHERGGHPQPARGLGRRVGATLRPLQHHRRVRPSRERPRSRRPTPRGASATGTRRRSSTPSGRCAGWKPPAALTP